jgi:hypothetical protein
MSADFAKEIDFDEFMVEYLNGTVPEGLFWHIVEEYDD